MNAEAFDDVTALARSCLFDDVRQDIAESLINDWVIDHDVFFVKVDPGENICSPDARQLANELVRQIRDTSTYVIVLLLGTALLVHKTPKLAQYGDVQEARILDEWLTKKKIRHSNDSPYSVQLLKATTVVQHFDYFDRFFHGRHFERRDIVALVLAGTPCLLACISHEALDSVAFSHPVLLKNMGKSLVRVLKQRHRVAQQVAALPNADWSLLPTFLKLAGLYHILDVEMKDLDFGHLENFRMTIDLALTKDIIAGMLTIKKSSVDSFLGRHSNVLGLSKPSSPIRYPRGFSNVYLYPFRIVPKAVRERLLVETGLTTGGCDRDGSGAVVPSADALAKFLIRAAHSFTWKSVRLDDRSLETYQAELLEWKSHIDSIHFASKSGKRVRKRKSALAP